MIELSSNIIEYISKLYGKEAADKYFQYIKLKHTSYIRFSRFYDQEKLLFKLSQYGIKLEKILEIPYAYKVIAGEEIIGKTLEYNIGMYYIQSLSSMIPPLVLSPGSSDTVLDTCSAPGSKATQMAEMMNNKGTLVVNESNLDRIKILVHNIDKTGLVNVGVLKNRAEFLSQIYNNHFDKILVDAPCSALGVLQKKGEVSNWWSVERVENITKVQLAILVAAIKMVKIGGEIVYSTCTLTPEENEHIIDQILEKYPVEILDIDVPLKSHEGFTSYNNQILNPKLKKARRILPWEVDSEGFFIVKLKKISYTESVLKSPQKANIPELLNYKKIERYLHQLSNDFGIEMNIWQNYNYLIKGTDIFFINKEWKDNNLDIFTRIGIQLGLIDKNNFAHLHTFAVKQFESQIKSRIFHLNTETQLKEYLNGSTIKVSNRVNGQFVISFRDNLLGTAVGINNGLKSQYPKSSRIHEIDHY